MVAAGEVNEGWLGTCRRFDSLHDFDEITISVQ